MNNNRRDRLTRLDRDVQKLEPEYVALHRKYEAWRTTAAESFNALQQEWTDLKAKYDDERSVLEQIRDEEQEAYDNLSEGLQQSEKGCDIEQAVSCLDEAVNALEELPDEYDGLVFPDFPEFDFADFTSHIDNASC